MIKSIVLFSLLSLASPTLEGVPDLQWDLHPSVGIIVTIDGNLVAYPIRMYERVDNCSFYVDKDKYLLTYRICYDTLILTLGHPTMWKPINGKQWMSMDNYKESQ